VSDELRICAAAFFRNKGKNVITENEFLMGISMNNRWMPYGDAERLLSSMITSKVVSKDGEYVRPCFDVAAVNVPVGYKPSKDILGKIPEDLFQTLIARASAADIDKKDFLSSCRSIQKRMDIDIEVAALILLRDKGADVSDLIGKVSDLVKGR